MEEFLEREKEVLEFIDPRTGHKNKFVLIAYNGDQAALMWCEEKTIFDPFTMENRKEWWEKDWWCYNSWEEAEKSIHTFGE